MRSLVPLTVPVDAPLFILEDRLRARGVHICSTSGGGKSLLLGRLACIQCLRNVPQIIWDPLGPLSDALLHNLLQLPEPQRSQVCERVWYLDFSGSATGNVALPLLYRLGNESLRDVAERPLSTFIALDSALLGAPLMGANALRDIGRKVGIVLAGLGRQLDDAPSLLAHPEAWRSRLEGLASTVPEAVPAVRYLLDVYLPLKPPDRAPLTASFMGKVGPFELDPALRSVFCQPASGLDITRLMEERATVICDFRGELNDERRRLKSRWLFDVVMTWVKHHGPGRPTELAVIIDELADIVGSDSSHSDALADDLDATINIWGRNYNLWLTLAHQEMYQFGPKIQKALLTMQYQLIGGSSDIEAAQFLARQLVGLDIFRVKRYRNVWASAFGKSYVIDTEPVDLPLAEQEYEAARAIMNLPPFEFLAGGRGLGDVMRVRVDTGTPPWPSEHRDEIAELRTQLLVPTPAIPGDTDDVPIQTMGDGTIKDSPYEEDNGTKHPGLEDVYRERIH